jgi:hypothetical protein
MRGTILLCLILVAGCDDKKQSSATPEKKDEPEPIVISEKEMRALESGETPAAPSRPAACSFVESVGLSTGPWLKLRGARYGCESDALEVGYRVESKINRVKFTAFGDEAGDVTGVEIRLEMNVLKEEQNARNLVIKAFKRVFSSFEIPIDQKIQKLVEEANKGTTRKNGFIIRSTVNRGLSNDDLYTQVIAVQRIESKEGSVE